jgi:glycosyltransferase involved in cell wall biosynthesis
MVGNKILKSINKINPDIVHLHWINNGTLKIEHLSQIKAPIVWSLHDMWAFTGGCHYDENCDKYKKNCGSCKVLGSNRENDLSRKIWQRKQKTYAKLKNITIVGLSSWLNSCSQESSLLKDKNHINIPNPIDTSIFKPSNKSKARKIWNLPTDKKLILFGAMGATSDPRKGFEELCKALQLLDLQNIELVIFGSNKPKNPPKLKFKTHYVGKVNKDMDLASLYNSADVMLAPSLQEAFGQTASEAMACNVPVVAFKTTGLMDIINHRQNGYLAKAFCTTDLKNGIEWVLNNKNYEEVCKDAREKIVRLFDSKVVAKKYINLYKQILDK